MRVCTIRRGFVDCSPYHIVQSRNKRIGTLPASFPKIIPSKVLRNLIPVSYRKPGNANETKYPRGGNGRQDNQFEESEGVLQTDTPFEEGAVDDKTECEAKECNETCVVSGWREGEGMYHVCGIRS